MMTNAMWHDKEREKNIKMYREEEKREVQHSKSYNKDFIRYIIRYYKHTYFLILVMSMYVNARM